mmetsp:Transcript_16020/g.30773  ORF Transcript_16020/g.30773 Transcript_16020/m.30773 type:complete len:272 (-) Transcript_16020:149-964(-)|eukprot:CAMPEP_0114242156 /NCGR_PEP_ID=MMETSP0058-20121206/10015_1 /TAXON_ID=36894 /ORGANISM="Pyramimonas parkeae, CCMP726" /LENGTH=271 /DNA_ID=CAMNT_0001354729 /DNA_START=174 /DNA_END=989 /DNA_ORIENTATION=+
MELLLLLWTVLGCAVIAILINVNLLTRILGTSPDLISRLGDVLLVIAHPDDEAMFFAPTLLGLAERGVRLHVLCLSTGNFAGLGDVRTSELRNSCVCLKIPPENVSVIDHPEMQDGMATVWKDEVVIQHVESYVQAHSISTVITFDEHGVSGHSNHRAVHRAVRLWNQMSSKESATALDASDSNSSTTNVCAEVWQLMSTSIVRKFIGVLDVLPSLLWASRSMTRMCFVASNAQLGREAMKMHASQWVWYRRLFVWFARYAYVNTLERLEK